MSSANVLFLFVMLLGPLVRISASRWIVCWVGIELRFIGLIPLLFLGNSYFSVNKERAVKYFCVQALGSALLFLGGLVVFGYLRGDWEDEMLFGIILFFSLILKLGAYPGHFWVLGVVSGLDWVPLSIVLVWQKVAPFCVLINLLENNPWMTELALIVAGFSSLVGSIIGLNQTNFRGILGASSIRHTGWGILARIYGSFWLYFSLYCLSFLVVVLFARFEMHGLTGLSVLRLRGLPPFLLFIGKWNVLFRAIVGGCHPFYLIFLLLGAFLSLFFYLKFLYSFYLEEKFSSVFKIYGYVLIFFILNISGRFYLLAC